MTEKRLNVGLLGGGQLSQMLLESAETLPITVSCLIEDRQDPATFSTSLTFHGKTDSESDLTHFFKQCEVIGFENEFLSPLILQKALNHSPKTNCFPTLPALTLSQDKLLQKNFFRTQSLPTSDFLEYSNNEPFEKWLQKVRLQFSKGAVLKWAKFGYDGKGVFFLNEKTPLAEARLFCEQTILKKCSLYAEERIEFVRELAMTASHSTKGEFKNYPLVQTFQKEGTCYWVKGPATLFGVERALEEEAKLILKKIAAELPLQGTFAVEFFETADGKLLINEMAPRVHNSSHYTREACAGSQFENHLRAITGMPLKDTAPRSNAFVMLNLLGPKNIFLDAMSLKDLLPSCPSSFHLKWYEKRELRAGRKMGHVTVLCDSAEDVEKKLLELFQYEQEWIDQLKDFMRSSGSK